MKLFIMQFSPVLCHCILPWPKYFPEHYILQHPQPMFFLYCERPKFHSHIKIRQNYTYICIQGVPGVKVSNSADAESKTSYTHGSNLQQFRSYAFLNFTHSFYSHVQNVTIPCCSKELLPFRFVMYFFLPPFSTNYSSTLSYFILPSISWSTSQSCCTQIYI